MNTICLMVVHTASDDRKRVKLTETHDHMWIMIMVTTVEVANEHNEFDERANNVPNQPCLCIFNGLIEFPGAML